MTKTIQAYFRDWEIHVFGYGDGIGEKHILTALKEFLALCNEGHKGGYDYTNLEAKLGPAVCWLLINTLTSADIIEHGVSTRYGWLTDQGHALKAFVNDYTVEQLIGFLDYELQPEILLKLNTKEQTQFLKENRDAWFSCSPTFCGCDPKAYQEKRCINPFFFGKHELWVRREFGIE
jgi:hypothetical protein